MMSIYNRLSKSHVGLWNKNTMSDFQLRKHSIKISGHATSITLENIFWQQLERMADEQNIPPSQLIEHIDILRMAEGDMVGEHKINLSSAIRVYILQYLLDTDVYFEQNQVE